MILQLFFLILISLVFEISLKVQIHYNNFSQRAAKLRRLILEIKSQFRICIVLKIDAC